MSKEKLKRANGVEVDKKPNDKERIAQLEAEQENIREEISKETMPFPSLTAPKIKFFLMALKKGSMTDEKYKKMLIKIFVNKIYLYDDRITITFHSGDDKVEINDRLLSELEEKDGEIKNLFLAGDGPPNSKKVPKMGLFLFIYTNCTRIPFKTQRNCFFHSIYYLNNSE